MEFLLFPLVFLVGGIIVALGAQRKENAEQKAKEKARSEWDSEQGKYERIIHSLPSELVSKLFDLLKQSCAQIRLVVPDTYPAELSKIFLATNTVINKGTYGTITREQHQQISNLLNKDFNLFVNEFIPAANTALRQLADSDGLGFGLITNSAADAMLYSALDTNERLKGNEKKIREYEEMIDKQVVSILDKIQKVLEGEYEDIETMQTECEQEDVPNKQEETIYTQEEVAKRWYVQETAEGVIAFIDEQNNLIFPNKTEISEKEILFALKNADRPLKPSEIQQATKYLRACRMTHVSYVLRQMSQASKIERFDENNIAYFKMK